MMKDALLFDVTSPGIGDTGTDFWEDETELLAESSTFFGTEQDAEAVMPAERLDDGQPHEDWVRGACPECGEPLVSNMNYVGGRGYLVVWECWGALAEQPTCTYRRVL